MVQAAEADVVGPAIAAEGPDRALDQVLGEGGELGRPGLLALGQLGLERGDGSSLRLDLLVVRLGILQELLDELGETPEPFLAARSSEAYSMRLSAESLMPYANSAASSKRLLDQAGPWPFSLTV